MRIIGTGSATPKKTITNDMLATFLDTSDSWITERTGIKQRQIMSEGESLEALAVEAAKSAIENAGVTANEINYIICSNTAKEMLAPTLSSIIVGGIGTQCPCMDVNAACAGFIFALDLADSLLSSGKAENILIVCAEEPTRMVDWNDRSTCVLFGDGAGAVVVSKGGEECTIKTNTVSKPEVLYYRGALQPTPFQGEEECTALRMNGQEVFKYAVSSSLHDIQSLLRSRNIDKENVKYYLLHQANVRIIDAIHHYMKVDECKFPRNIAKYGNTSSASIPILLDELNRAGGLESGDWLVMSAFGAGFTSGALLIKWDK
ncbi:MAG: ketoacyl-ACP synthase III [Tidjanibacter sp.]|nr:ketoacyl-ACP synthase III [Tidjanibacter sp.]